MRQPSGLYVPLSKPKFKCEYALDERLDKDLVNLNQRLYRHIQPMLGDQAKITMQPGLYLGRQLLPDPVQSWVIYYASLIAGAADAALTLSLHNLGREARILERQVFEYVMKAWYFQRHRREAKWELEAMPFRQLRFYNQTGMDKRRKLYREVRALVTKLKKTRPALARYAKKTEREEGPSLMTAMPGRKKSSRKTESYARSYRWPSQTLHGTVLGMDSVFKEAGIQFDSRLDDGNLPLWGISQHVLTFLTIVDSVFALHQSADIAQSKDELVGIGKRLGYIL